MNKPPKHKFKPGQKFWMIYRTTGNKRCPPRWRHETLEQAQEEANRLAAENPGILYAILETVGAAFVPRPAVVRPTVAPVDAVAPVATE